MFVLHKNFKMSQKQNKNNVYLDNYNKYNIDIEFFK